MNERSRNTFGMPKLQTTKKEIFLVHRARAGLIDEDASWHMLSAGNTPGLTYDVQ